MAKKVQIEDLFKTSYEVFRLNWLPMILASLVVTVGSILIITAPPLLFGYYLMSIKILERKKVSTMDVLEGFNYFFRSWGIVLLTGIITVIGYVLLVVPGIILSILFMFTMPLSAKKNLGVVDSVKSSYALAKKNFWFSALLLLILFAINVVANFFPILYLFTLPLTYIAATEASLKLR